MFAKLFILSSCLIVACICSVAREAANPQRGANKCLSQTYQLGEMDYNQISFVKGECIKAECNKDGTLTYYGCGSVAAPDNCRLNEPDLTKNYPDCCATTFTCA